MNKNITLFCCFVLSFMFNNYIAQIVLDGNDADWETIPQLLTAPNNTAGMYPESVGAAITDVVDIKEAKAVVIGNVLYGLLRFWGGPAWPNNAYTNEYEGIEYYASRGYYRFLIDLDNNVLTGWNTAWYEEHYTPVGYLQSVGNPEQYPIGAEVFQEWEGRTNDKWQQINESRDYVRNLSYWAFDYSQYDGETDTGPDSEIYEMEIPNPDSVKMMIWEGFIKIGDSDDPTLVDDYYSYWVGHAWGTDFLEFGIDLAPMQKYWTNMGLSYLGAGDVIGICGMTETPFDNWGIDVTTRGELTLPDDMPNRTERSLELKTFLEGPYDSGEMSTLIIDQLPKSQPFSGIPWNYNGDESVIEIPENVVDWVLVELRNKDENTVIVSGRAAFILKNGQIVDIDGISDVTFDVFEDDYYVVIKQRNHLPIMSATKIHVE